MAVERRDNDRQVEELRAEAEEIERRVRVVRAPVQVGKSELE